MMIPKTAQVLIPVDSLPDVGSVLIEVKYKFVIDTVLFGNVPGEFSNCDEFCVVVVEFAFVDGTWAPEMLVALAVFTHSISTRNIFITWLVFCTF